MVKDLDKGLCSSTEIREVYREILKTSSSTHLQLDSVCIPSIVFLPCFLHIISSVSSLTHFYGIICRKHFIFLLIDVLFVIIIAMFVLHFNLICQCQSMNL